MNKVYSRFGLTKDPFTKDVPVDELFDHAGREKALRRLKAALDNRASAVLTGEPGVPRRGRRVVPTPFVPLSRS